MSRDTMEVKGIRRGVEAIPSRRPVGMTTFPVRRSIAGKSGAIRTIDAARSSYPPACPAHRRACRSRKKRRAILGRLIRCAALRCPASCGRTSAPSGYPRVDGYPRGGGSSRASASSACAAQPQRATRTPSSRQYAPTVLVPSRRSRSMAAVRSSPRASRHVRITGGSCGSCRRTARHCMGRSHGSTGPSGSKGGNATQERSLCRRCREQGGKGRRWTMRCARTRA